MAQSTTNLGKIHVFPSETLYNQFKDIIADNDLALLKDDGAYIVAALLEQNGYVKFSNGLILQWGYCSDNQGFSARMITFPLGFSNACYSLIASTKNESMRLEYNSGNGIVLSKTQAKIIFDGEGGYWFAVGR